MTMSRTLKLMIALAVLYTTNAQQGSQFKSPSRPIDANDEEDSSPEAATPVQYRYRPQQQSQQQQQYEYSDEDEDAPVSPVQQYQRPVTRPTYVQQQPAPQQQKRIGISNTKKQKYADELADEQEEPDRLALLLAKSDFQCRDHVTGYYADESVGCEVFHYCQDGVKHSWVCPEGFTFHQVHLICMPPSSENICEQSSKYHVVNEYLYKPLNMEEHQSKPNVTLRYSDRYFPGEIYYDDRRPEYESERAAYRAPAPRKQQNHHVATTTGAYRQPQQQQGYNQNAYRSPEDINISLQQRRPTVQPQRYDEEEYDSYEK